MFQTDLVIPGPRAWLVALALAGWCGGAEPSTGLSQPPLPTTSAGPTSPAIPPPATRPGTLPPALSTARCLPDVPAPTCQPTRSRRTPRDPTLGPSAGPACSGHRMPRSPAPETPTPSPTFPLPWRTPVDPPTGFTGKSSILPREGQSDPHFVPLEDRWRIGYPEYDRYGNGHPVGSDYLYQPGRILDPFNQNVLKGDLSDHRPAHLPRRHRHRRHVPRGPADADGDDAVREHRPAVRVQLLRPAEPVALPRTSSCCRSTCSTAMPRSSRSTGGSS